MKYLFFLALLFSCTHPQKPQGEKSLRRVDAPAFLIAATPSGNDISDIEYFFEVRPDGTIYELKYEKNDREISIEYDEGGHFLESEEDIDFEELSSEVKEKINIHLGNRFGKYKIHETEKRKTKAGVKLIDVEVSYAKGLMEVSFSEEGTFVSEEVEEMPGIETLN